MAVMEDSRSNSRNNDSCGKGAATGGGNSRCLDSGAMSRSDDSRDGSSDRPQQLAAAAAMGGSDREMEVFC